MPSPTVLRPYSSATDAAYLPTLLRTSILSNISRSDVLFLLHPLTLTSLGLVSAGLLYQLRSLFFNYLQVPGEEDGWNEYASWQDSLSLVIYCLPPIAAVLGTAFALAHWLHTRIWTVVAEQQVKTIDVLDPEGYYGAVGGDKVSSSRSTTSGLYCLEYDNEIVSCFGMDAKHPASILKVLPEAQLPDAAEKTDEKEVDLDTDEDARDMALFRHSRTTEDEAKARDAASEAPAQIALGASHAGASESTAQPSPRRFSDQDYEPVGNLLSASSPTKVEQKESVVEIRHLTIAPTYRAGRGVQGQILDLALRTVFGATGASNQSSSSASSSDTPSGVVLVVNRSTEKDLRKLALQRGFRRIATVPLDTASIDPSSNKPPVVRGAIERLLLAFWPLDFAQEVLYLDRQVFKATPGR